MVRIDPRIKYNFKFKRSFFTNNPISWEGASVVKFWNDIYDHFWNSGEMILKKNVGEFSKKEIRNLFWHVFEDMEEDQLVIGLIIQNLYTLKLTCFEGNYLKRRSLSNLNNALRDFESLKLKSLCKGFKINNPERLKQQKFSDLKRVLESYKKSQENNGLWVTQIYSIAGFLKRKYNELISNNAATQIRKITNKKTSKGSRHEWEGDILKHIPTKDKKKCNQIIKNSINLLVSKSKINSK